METQLNSNVFKPGRFIGWLLALGGLVLAGALWDAGETWLECLKVLGLYAFFGMWTVMVEEGINTGKLVITHGHVYRDKNPVAFWCFVVTYIVIILVFMSGITVYYLEELGLM